MAGIRLPRPDGRHGSRSWSAQPRSPGCNKTAFPTQTQHFVTNCYFCKNRKKPQAMLTISYSEFVADQAKFFDLAVRERVLIERPGKSAVALGPVSELEEYYANPDVKADILLAEKQIKKGEYRQVHADTLWDDIR